MGEYSLTIHHIRYNPRRYSCLFEHISDLFTSRDDATRGRYINTTERPPCKGILEQKTPKIQ